jgi:hypothetical protein
MFPIANHKSQIANCKSLFLIAVLLAGCGQRSVVNSNSAPANSPVNRTNEEPPKGRKESRLQAESDALVRLFGKMPKVEVFVTDEPIEKKAGSETERGVAYTTCSTEKVPTIFVKNSFYTKAPLQQRSNILKHELTHAWFCTQGIQTGHDSRFRAKFKQVGGFGN